MPEGVRPEGVRPEKIRLESAIGHLQDTGDLADIGQIEAECEHDRVASIKFRVDRPDPYRFFQGIQEFHFQGLDIIEENGLQRLLGNPHGVHARTMGHPRSKVAQSRTAAILDYGEHVRCSLSINHDHFFGRRFQACEFRICGTEGAAYVKLGVNLDYPRGEPDELWIRPRGGDWVQVPLRGAWFPDAFVGRMANLQRSVAGEDGELVSAVEDAWQTMALVEAAYESSASPATALAPLPR